MSRSESISHEQARELLPWLVNDSLEEDERELILAHATSCVTCRRDLAELESLRDSIALSSGQIDVPAPDMRRINARIDALIENEDRTRTLVTKTREFLLSPWRVAFVAQTALLLVLAIVLVWPQAQQAEYTTLTNQGARVDDGNIRIVFDPHRETAELTEILATLDLVIVDGPSPRGVATVRVSESASATQRDELISDLLRNPGILFAEPASTGRQ